MTSSSTDGQAAANRSRRVRLGWLLTVFAVAVAGPTIGSTSALYTATDTTGGTVTVASNNAVPVVTAWNPTLWWRFDAGTPVLGAEHSTAFLPADATDAVTLTAASSSGPAALASAPEWTAVLWVVPGTPGRVLTFDGPSALGSIALDVTAGGRIQLMHTQSLDAKSTSPLASTPHFVVLTGSGGGLTFSVDGSTPVPVAGDPSVAAVTLGAYGPAPATPAADAQVDEVVVVPGPVAPSDLELVRTAGSWATPTP